MVLRVDTGLPWHLALMTARRTGSTSLQIALSAALSLLLPALTASGRWRPAALGSYILQLYVMTLRSCTGSLRTPPPTRHCLADCSTPQSQKAVTSHLQSKQLLPFYLARWNTTPARLLDTDAGLSVVKDPPENMRQRPNVGLIHRSGNR